MREPGYPREVVTASFRELFSLGGSVSPDAKDQAETDTTSSSGPQIGLLHHVGGGNLGDNATLDAALKNIKARWPRAVPIAFCLNPEDTRRRHAIAAYPARRTTWPFGYKAVTPAPTFTQKAKTRLSRHRFLFGLLRAINAVAVRWPLTLLREIRFLLASRRILRSCSTLIVCGGGQLTEWGGPWGFPYTLFKWILLARSVRVKCLFLNVGAGPLDHPLSKFFVKRALHAAHYISFRDAASRTLVRELGFAGLSQVFPDTAYSLDPPKLQPRGRAPNPQPVVGVAPMPYLDPRTFPAAKDQIAYDHYIRKLAIFSSWLVRHSYDVALFGTDIGVDPLAIHDVQTALRAYDRAALDKSLAYDSVATLHELLSKMSSMDYIVTCRYHGVVFAHLLNKPVLALAHHPKVADIMSDLGLSKYCVDIRKFDLDLLADTFESLVQEADEIKGRLAETLAGHKRELTRQFNALFPPG
jgi:polysaccharide pyruvyl transferase WcaK-like protein